MLQFKSYLRMLLHADRMYQTLMFLLRIIRQLREQKVSDEEFREHIEGIVRADVCMLLNNIAGIRR